MTRVVNNRYRLGQTRLEYAWGSLLDGYDLVAFRKVTLWQTPQVRPSVRQVLIDNECTDPGDAGDAVLTAIRGEQGSDSSATYIVYERRLVSTVRETLRRAKPTAVPAVVRSIASLMGVLPKLYASGRVHGRISPASVLVEDNRCLLMGFGMRFGLPHTQLPPELRRYVAPEVWTDGDETWSADMYGIGMMLLDALRLSHSSPVDSRMSPLACGKDTRAMNVVERLTADRPGDRFNTPGEAWEAVRRAFDGRDENR